MGLPPLILASRSPRRKRLLRQIGLKFTVRPSDVREDVLDHEPPERNAKRIALTKARQIAKGRKSGIVIGADTIVVLGKRILGKPRTQADARRMLRSLSGRTHTVYTAFALIDAATQKKTVRIEKTKVWFRTLSRREIAEYVASGSPMDKAGAYGIQDDYGAVFVERVEGCFYNVVGFPLTKFYKTLQEFLHHRR
ncbi:MAG: Septum formation protein Maf [Bacteroidetes bacterium]|nr:Septum formation protein Maf [Bacteroidota bacterium]